MLKSMRLLVKFLQRKSQKGKIIDIIQGGYKIGDNIITYPKVVVAQ